MFAALNRDIKLTMLKASSCTGLFPFPVCLSSYALQKLKTRAGGFAGARRTCSA
jgi:hypothetical protein